ncbi:MAG: N-6 DNA methylase, partial [Bacillota bacterium]|nr:N-6 DNA methylase [Bacillota bacterium]
MSVPETVVTLVERFHENRDSYRRAAYNEAQVRQEFINPLFEALGWDVSNRRGYAEPYKEVVHEASLRVEGVPRAPDYSFRIGGTRKFFVEAKKPAVDLKEGAAAAFQLRRYAWSANLPVSILTDFEEWAVYDTRIKPQKSDKPSRARISYLRFEDYPARWEELSSAFGREAVLKGSFDRFVQTAASKRGTSEVDTAFLAEIEGWRDVLARTMALRNPDLSGRALNAVVQRTIDRVVFLRISEDRGVEPYGQLRDAVAREDAYSGLLALYAHADRKYNSGLFHFRQEKGRAGEPDTLSMRLKVDSKALQSIVRGLYYPECPYEFSVLPSHILGSVYERFLGSVIRLTAGHRAVVEEKPEVRKAGGVYYTPRPIVRYIVEHAVAPLLGGRTPDDLKDLRIVDPACGSGSFLLEAYHYLLAWHHEWYTANRDRYRRKYRGRLREDALGRLWLSGEERKRILLAHIYGVDIDPQAVEVTKLSLLLSVLEGETAESLNAQMTLFASRALPDLGGNIKCGNALISDDFFSRAGQLDLIGDERLFEVNPFNWSREFPDVFGDGGFSAVIGNPPYVLIQDRFRDEEQLSYVRENFEVASYKVDTYHLFMERGFALTRPGGRCAMITPANFLTNNHLKVLREHLLKVGRPDHVLVLDGGVFEKVSVDNAIFVMEVGGALSPFPIRRARYDNGRLTPLGEYSVDPAAVLSDPHRLFTGSAGGELGGLWANLDASSLRLGGIAHVNFGKQLRDRRLFERDVITVFSLAEVPPDYVPCLTGQNVGRYHVRWGGLACLDDPIARRGGTWDRERHEANPKLLTRQIGRYPEFGLDTNG